MNNSNRHSVKFELDRLTAEFFRAVSFEVGRVPPYENLHALFIRGGLLIKNVGSTPEISSVHEFITPRQAQVEAGTLTCFHEDTPAGWKMSAMAWDDERPGLLIADVKNAA